VRSFAREEFALKHRYLLALHTDEPHPHVHMVIKAMSEQGRRLHIRKATLRGWRSEFARHLRAVGVRANATERIVRGELRNPIPDPLYRLLERGALTHRNPDTPSERARTVVERARPSQYAVMNGWLALADALERAGYGDLAEKAIRLSEAAPRQRALFHSESARDRQGQDRLHHARSDSNAYVR
jgi:hypothetical protein